MNVTKAIIICGVVFGLGCQRNRDPVESREKPKALSETPQKPQPAPPQNDVVDTETEKTVKEILETSKDISIDEDSVANNAADQESKSQSETQTKPTKKTKQVSRGKQLYDTAIQNYHARQWDKAREHYLQSCQLGYAPGCHRYGWHQQGLGNLTTAVRFYRVACRRGVAKSCNNVGWIAEQIKSYAQAQNFYTIACQSNHKKACANMTRISAMLKDQETTTKIAH